MVPGTKGRCTYRTLLTVQASRLRYTSGAEGPESVFTTKPKIYLSRSIVTTTINGTQVSSSAQLNPIHLNGIETLSKANGALVGYQVETPSVPCPLR